MAELQEEYAVVIQRTVRGWLERGKQSRLFVEQMRAQVEAAIDESLELQRRRVADADDRRRRAEECHRRMGQLAKKREEEGKHSRQQRMRSQATSTRWSERRRAVVTAEKEREVTRREYEERELRRRDEQRKVQRAKQAEELRRLNEERRRAVEQMAEEARRRGLALRARWKREPTAAEIAANARRVAADRAARRDAAVDETALVGDSSLPEAVRKHLFSAACALKDEELEWCATREERLQRAADEELEWCATREERLQRAADADRERRRRAVQREMIRVSGGYTAPPPPPRHVPGATTRRERELEEGHGRQLLNQLAYQRVHAAGDTLDALAWVRSEERGERRRRLRAETEKRVQAEWEEEC
eukprot:TRINITY_DN28313_c0_g1_i1.p1 TRINITY_DN28313_c0_g1~~TRINITY_DN28313_c0_g1_i1.p1  ORF type:complete len:407 (+),score=205.28 TRINITY_DN28313_c0_g1_i1:134-1222(+)